MEKYKNEEGLIGVLVSHGYGAGWSTWALENEAFLTMDKTLVEMKLRKATESEVEAYLVDTLGKSTYMGGWHDIDVEYIKEGTAFTIEEYDGSESIRTLNDLTMIA